MLKIFDSSKNIFLRTPMIKIFANNEMRKVLESSISYLRNSEIIELFTNYWIDIMKKSWIF